MTDTLRDIFKPTWPKLVLTVAFTVFWHYYLVEEAIRQTAETELGEARSFWLVNFVNSLPYFETDNTILKFLIFFVGSYLVVWLFSLLWRSLDNIQLWLTKRLRRQA